MTIAAPPPVRRGHGCLWGCLAVIAVIALPLMTLTGYGTWLFYHSLAGDEGLRRVVDSLKGNGLVLQVLGDDVHIAGIEGSAISGSFGSGDRAIYIVRLEGSKGTGTTTVTAQIFFTHIHVLSLTLVGPDGTHYDLLRHTLTPPQNSI